MLNFYRDNPSCYRSLEAFISDLNLISKMSPKAAVGYIRNVMGYDSFLKEEALRQNTTFDEYKETIEFFVQTVSKCRTIKMAIDDLNILKLKVDYENKNKSQDREGKIGLYTLHSSKGLEFKNVIIIGANDGIMPSNKAEGREALEAERRLFYVGITRTKQNLLISYTNKKNRDKSRFLDEMNINYSSISSE